jgi:hypothetical protein
LLRHQLQVHEGKDCAPLARGGALLVAVKPNEVLDSRFQSLAFIAVMDPAFVSEFDVLANDWDHFSRDHSVSHRSPMRICVDVLVRLSRALNFRQRRR